MAMSPFPDPFDQTPVFCPCCDNAIGTSPPLGDEPCPLCGRSLWFVKKEVDEAVILVFLPGLKSGSEGEKGADDVLSAAGDQDVVVIDLSRLRLLSSSFLGLLVALHNQLQAANRQLKICGVSSDAYESLQTTNLSDFLEVYEDERAALASA
jgi:anti-anti-sigma factor